VLAAVLTKPPQSMYDTLVLDAGENLGIVVGGQVTLSDAATLGVIDEVFGRTSRAKLFSSVDTETPAVIDRTDLSVTLIGRGAGNFEIRLPQEVDIMKGDVIRLPGMTPSVVATVVEVESNPTNSFKRVFCKMPINIAELRWVSVLPFAS
jgi:cell shape-determining protein MreC